MANEQLGRIASRPRWRATPRAMLRCLSLSALIACAGCNRQPPLMAGDANVLTSTDDFVHGVEGVILWVDPETGCRYLKYYSNSMTIRYRRDGLPDCPASGTETRQGGDGTAPSRSDDGPTRNAGDAR